MDKFITSIKKKYQERRGLHLQKQWPPCHSSKIITLVLVNRKADEGYFGNKQRDKTAMERVPNSLHYSELFETKKGKRPVRKILIEGDAGIGKTTFCISLSEDWANGEIWQQFELLLLLPLCYRTVSSAGCLLELLKLLHPSAKVCESVASYLEEGEGEKVLIIADGWDELDKLSQEEGSFLYKLLFEILPFASVVLTSRPTASASLRQSQCIDRCVEIHGFSKVKSRAYIQSEFANDQEKAKRLLKQLKVTPFVESICSIPLNCAILCHLWRTREEALPTTMTGLYTKIILNIILHNLQKKEAYKSIDSLANFDALPDDLVESWQLLCEFAYRAMEEDQIVFSREELARFFPERLALDEKIFCFGLLQSAKPVLETGYGVSFHFLHQIFQEYLAALHIVKQPLDKQLEIIELKPSISAPRNDERLSGFGLSSHDYNDGIKLFMSLYYRIRRFSLVWRFFCGIYFHESNRKAQQSSIEPLMKSLFTTAKTIIQPTLFEGCLHLCLLGFEARNAIFSQKVIQFQHEANKEFKVRRALSPCQESEPVTIVLGRPFMSAYDCAAIVYLISNIQEYTSIPLLLNFSYSGIGEDSIRALADALASKNGELQIQRLNLDGNQLTDKSVGDLFGRASAAFKSLHILEVSDNRIRAESLNSIATPLEELSFRRLLTLDLSLNRLGDSGVQALGNAACSYAFVHLHNLNLQGSLTDDAYVNSDLLLTFAIHCQKLNEINVSYNNLGASGAIPLSMIISRTNYVIPKLYSKAIEEAVGHAVDHHDVIGPPFMITINRTNLGDFGLILFVEMLKESNIHFSALDLSDNDIHEIGISYLVRAISSKNIVIEKRSDEFLLGNNPLGTNGALTIGKMLSSCYHEFTTINLSQCQLTTTASEIALSGNAEVIDAREVGQQLCEMPQNTILTELNVDGNNFTGEGIYILAGFMHLCPSLKLLYCSNCQITSKDLLRLFEILSGQFSSSCRHPCSELMLWHLNHNGICDRGLAALLELLPSLFPQLCCHALHHTFAFQFDDNFVSAKMAMKVNNEMKRRMEANIESSQPVTVTNNIKTGDKIEDSPSIDTCVTPISQSTDAVTSTAPSTANCRQPIVHEHAERSTSQQECVTKVHPAFPSQESTPSPVEQCPSLSTQSPTDTSGKVEEILTVNDLKSVQRAVWEGRSRWYDIGLELGLTAGTLDAIQKTNHHVVDDCFRETLKEWLSGTYQVKPSWNSLVESLRAPPVGLGELAEQLLKNL